ncbi:MAG: DUF333 domain-containing protein [Pseudomonadota bacterium]|nr:DUF333 domain-containing protein [Pseudomonadota bacterium]
MLQIKKLSWLPMTLTFLSLLIFSSTYALPNPAATLCASFGYTIKDGNCVFPDNSQCEQWAFWRGECGKQYHICTLSNGTIQTLEKTQTPVCVIEGKLFTWTLSNQDNADKWTVKLQPISEETSVKDASLSLTKPASA